MILFLAIFRYEKNRRKSPVNIGPLTTKFWVCILTHPNKLFFRKATFRPLGGLLAQIFTRARLASAYPIGVGGPPTIYKNEHLKIGLKFSVNF